MNPPLTTAQPPAGSHENKFTIMGNEPDPLPPRAECNPKAFMDWWLDITLWLDSCYSRKPSNRDYVKRIRLSLDKSWRDILKLDLNSCSLADLRAELESEIL